MKLLVGLLLSLSGISGLAAPIVTDSQGRSMDVEVIAYNQSSGNLKIKRSDGQQFNVKIGMFDVASQQLIAENAPKLKADLDIKVSVGKRRSRQGDSSYMKDQTISASVAVENESRDIDFPEGNGTLLLIARQTKRYSEDGADYGKVLSKQKFNIAAKSGEATSVEAKPIVTSYDSDRDSTNVGGWEYYGYAFILVDADGEIYTVETSIGNLKKDVEENPVIGKELLALGEGSLVEKNLATRKQ